MDTTRFLRAVATTAVCAFAGFGAGAATTGAAVALLTACLVLFGEPMDPFEIPLVVLVCGLAGGIAGMAGGLAARPVHWLMGRFLGHLLGKRMRCRVATMVGWSVAGLAGGLCVSSCLRLLGTPGITSFGVFLLTLAGAAAGTAVGYAVSYRARAGSLPGRLSTYLDDWDHLEELTSAATPVEAKRIRDNLRARGVPCVLAGGTLHRLARSVGLGQPIRVQTPQRTATAAREALLAAHAVRPELEAASAPEGLGIEPESAPPPAGRGTEISSAAGAGGEPEYGQHGEYAK